METEGRPELRVPVQGSKGSLDNINLFSIITILSFLLLTPFALLRDGGFTFSASSMRGMGILDPNLVMRRAVLAGFCFHAYQQVITAASGDAGSTRAPVSLLHAASRVGQSSLDSKRTQSYACLPCTSACGEFWGTHHASAMHARHVIISLCLQVSYMILQRVSPVTHSIGNCLKRVIVIVASVIFFQNPMSQQNMLGMPLPLARSSLSALIVESLSYDRLHILAVRLDVTSFEAPHIRHMSAMEAADVIYAGTGIALAGVFAYSQVKRSQSKKKIA